MKVIISVILWLSAAIGLMFLVACSNDFSHEDTAAESTVHSQAPVSSDSGDSDPAPAEYTFGSSLPSSVPVPPISDSVGRWGHQWFIDVDNILNSLPMANIAFNTPEKMRVNESHIIQLVLGLENSHAELQQLIDAADSIDNDKIKVSTRMQARLTGANFSITAINPEVQGISSVNVTEWNWEVKPISEGDHDLHLTMSVILRVEGSDTPHTIRTFSKLIKVEVHWQQWLGKFIYENLQWLWAILVVPLAGWVWRKKLAP